MRYTPFYYQKSDSSDSIFRKKHFQVRIIPIILSK